MRNNLWRVCGVLACLVAITYAGPLTVDGNLANDWGINVLDGPIAGDTTPSNINEYGGMTVDGLTVWFHSEDTNDTSNSYSLGPYSGGQNYDGEFLGATIYDNKLWISVVSGQRPDNGPSLYSPGDIRITTDSGVFGVEVGGGAYSTSDTGYAIVEGDYGSTYSLNGSGYTVSVLNTFSPAAGSMWFEPTWKVDPIDTSVPKQIDPSMYVGVFAGMADYTFTRNSSTGQHSVIEMSVPLAYFTGFNLQTIEWRPSCGNDELSLIVELNAVPEPGSLALLLAGVACLALRRRRKKTD